MLVNMLVSAGVFSIQDSVDMESVLLQWGAFGGCAFASAKQVEIRSGCAFTHIRELSSIALFLVFITSKKTENGITALLSKLPIYLELHYIYIYIYISKDVCIFSAMPPPNSLPLFVADRDHAFKTPQPSCVEELSTGRIV